MTDCSLFGSHPLYGSQLWRKTNKETQNKIKKLQDKVLWTIMYKKEQDPSEQLQKELKIFVHLQNCLFMFQRETKNLHNHLLN